MKISIEKKLLSLNYPWKISRNTSYQKTNFIVCMEQDGKTGLGEVAPNIRYDETPERIMQEFKQLDQNKFTNVLPPIDDFTHWLNQYNLSQSFRFGLESAFIHLFCETENINVCDFLGTEPINETDTCFSIPIMEPENLEKFFIQWKLDRFKALKLKINKESGIELVNKLSQLTKQSLRIDANESFTSFENCMEFIDKLHPYNIQFIEQPLSSNLSDDYKMLRKNCPYSLFADESITNEMNVELISEQFNGINMKLMKAGGYLNGIKILKSARHFNLETMIGCMVETSLGIYSALNLVSLADYIDLDGFLVVKDEPFGFVTERNGRIYRK
ncbi:MAG: hypothetical protein A3H98_04800 [Bacteroidetes bacterium RIFCSPLOWO2_02_FULL_36_8]|nr:MAG: hypothetical protein A3H98_04800 [Bacteroidetes bacterium RIFCSPLOWO2_02_FULL_36_8]OFY70701.1 MAG: hypothetical protein A3G23_08265 [Bacteroidetes bacterium RIFCSPLOWO2_12_FULL_37_12]